MNIDSFRGTDTDLGRFLKYLEGIENTHMDIDYEDWDNMCGITLSNSFAGTKNDTLCFSFEEDGKHRAISVTTEENQRQQYIRARDRELKRIGFFELAKIWLVTRFSNEN